MKHILVALVVAAAGCGDDVATGTPDAHLGGGCTTSPDNCSGETLCIANTCVVAFPRVYQITGIRVALPTTNNGAAWDVGGGAPDPLAKISVNGTVVATTPAQQDTFTATFTGPFDVMLVGGSTLLVDIFDEDVTTNDHAYACTGTITADLVRARVLACGAGPILTYALNPK